MYDVCPVCWWEDDGGEPWEYSGPNAQTLVDAQRKFLKDQRPFRRRLGHVRAPRTNEARDSAWRPLELTPELLERAARSVADEEREMELERRRAEKDLAEHPEGPFKAYNAGSAEIRSRAGRLTHAEIEAELAQLGQVHGIDWPAAYLELLARTMSEENYYRHHPLQAVSWMLRHSRPGNYRLRWREMRTGTIHGTFAE